MATLPPHGTINIVDIGALMLGGEEEPFRRLVDAGNARVVGFEPNEQECAKLNARGGPARYYPYFIGDGSERTYYETNYTMTGSLYRPNTALLNQFTFLGDLVKMKAEHPGIKTRRLDDLADLDGLDDVDLIKIDVQGAELDVFRGASRALESAVMIITEVEFIQLYEGQPLFGDIDCFLRGRGFAFHTFNGFGQRFFQPFYAPDKPNAGLRQMLWSDAVYVKDFMRLDRLTDEKLLRLVTILGATVGSYDLAALVLKEYDRRHGTAHSPGYVNTMLQRQAAARAKAS